MTRPALELMQQLAREIWATYDDTYGYRSEKQAANNSINLD